ncbi:hypothetical protein KIN20_005609 [Parelaphostrongylus tenuis]|uniref:Uncharacterized protein n=1 Tax=Parelaphostrongylus tenuis TaxID=148309 RepID=A0AAD5QIQ3_PARTN|nr:hypothetical protein KIN20_005609 [Parelaphostrongylus tenuis]
MKSFRCALLTFLLLFSSVNSGHNCKEGQLREIRKLADLLAEEELREKAGEYDPDLDSDDEETKEKLELARQIREKEKLITLENQMNKAKAGRHVSRLNVRKRERSMSSLEQQMGELGVEIEAKRMKHLQTQAQKSQHGKKMRVGRSPSLSASRPPPRDELGIPDKAKRAKAAKLRANALKHLKREARKGEADRHVYDLKPKHLFSGKRKMGKTDRR